MTMCSASTRASAARCSTPAVGQVSIAAQAPLHLLTLRCPGISLFPLVPHFKRAIGVDPSEGMISEAGGAWEAYCGSALQGKRPDTLVEFKQGSAEKLTCIDDASVDLVTAAQVRAQQP